MDSIAGQVFRSAQVARSGLHFLLTPVRKTAAYGRVRRVFARRKKDPRRSIEGVLALIRAVEAVRPMSGASVVEIGTGRILNVAILSWLAGAERIVAVDKRIDLDPRLIASQIDYCRANRAWLTEELSKLKTGKARRLERLLSLDARTPKKLTGRILTLCRVERILRTDAGHIGDVDIPGGRCDVHLSNGVLEHVPPDELPGILKSGAGLLEPDGVTAHAIDLYDHSVPAPASPPLPVPLPSRGLGFLRFDDADWLRRRKTRFPENRLRASEYPPMFTAAGLEIRGMTNFVSEECLRAIESGRLPLARKFSGMDARDLATLSTIIVAGPRSRAPSGPPPTGGAKGGQRAPVVTIVADGNRAISSSSA